MVVSCCHMLNVDPTNQLKRYTSWRRNGEAFLGFPKLRTNVYALLIQTYSTVLNFIMVMALHPQIQQRAFEELAGVVGRERLPTVTDRDKLPYLSAVIKETMRWSPVLPLSESVQPGSMFL